MAGKFPSIPRQLIAQVCRQCNNWYAAELMLKQHKQYSMEGLPAVASEPQEEQLVIAQQQEQTTPMEVENEISTSKQVIPNLIAGGQAGTGAAASLPLDAHTVLGSCWCQV